MRDCCKTGDEQEPKKNNWPKRLLYLAILLALGLVIFEQINS